MGGIKSIKSVFILIITSLTNCTVKGNTSVKGNNDFIEEIRSKNIINNGQ